MRADVQNLFISIHMLHHAHSGQSLTIRDMQPQLEEYGYQLGEREVKQQLEHLTQENFLTLHGDEYSITGAGIEEFKETQNRLKTLCGIVLQPLKQKESSSNT